MERAAQPLSERESRCRCGRRERTGAVACVLFLHYPGCTRGRGAAHDPHRRGHLHRPVVAGAQHDAIAQRLGIPVGRSSRAPIPWRTRASSPQAAVVPPPAAGKGATEADSPVQRPVQTIDTGAVPSVDTGAVQPFDTGPVQRLDQLEDEVQGLRRLVQSVVDRLDHPPVQTPVQITTLPPYPKGKAVRWNLWIFDAIRDELAALAAERDVSPSQLVQELLWQVLTDRRSSTSWGTKHTDRKPPLSSHSLYFP